MPPESGLRGPVGSPHIARSSSAAQASPGIEDILHHDQVHGAIPPLERSARQPAAAAVVDGDLRGWWCRGRMALRRRLCVASWLGWRMWAEGTRRCRLFHSPRSQATVAVRIRLLAQQSSGHLEHAQHLGHGRLLRALAGTRGAPPERQGRGHVAEVIGRKFEERLALATRELLDDVPATQQQRAAQECRASHRGCR